MLRKRWTVAGASTLMLTILVQPLSGGEAQKNKTRGEYDFYTLALVSVFDSESEVLKLSDIPSRFKLLIYAAKILPPSHRNQALHFLDLALIELKQWRSEGKIGWSRRNAAATWRNEILTAYAAIDAERAMTIRKELQTLESNSGNDSENSKNRNDNWYLHFRQQRTVADQAAKLALSLLSSDTEKASGLVIESVQGGVVSGVLFDIVEKLQESGQRPFLHELEVAMGQALVSNVTFDPSSLKYASILLSADDEMPAGARSAFVSFLMRSLEAWTSLVREPGTNGWVDVEYISNTFTAFTLNVRPVLVQHSPKQLLRFDWLLEQIGSFVPETTKTKLQAFQPETFSDPSERLTDILKDPFSERRDLRLLGLVSQLLRSLPEDFQKTAELASNAISHCNDSDFKSAFSDLLVIARVDALVKQNKLIEAQNAAQSISSTEMRAWALLAVSTAASKADRVLGFELLSNALKVLDSASPSPHKVELALSATAMLAKDNPERAFETLSAASRYANSSPFKIDEALKTPVAFGLDATIGQVHARLGVVPSSLSELKIDKSLSLLGTVDWFRANQIVREIHEPSLRLQLKLQFAEAVLAQTVPSKANTTAHKGFN